jgi:hypothetical protein
MAAPISEMKKTKAEQRSCCDWNWVETVYHPAVHAAGLCEDIGNWLRLCPPGLPDWLEKMFRQKAELEAGQDQERRLRALGSPCGGGTVRGGEHGAGQDPVAVPSHSHCPLGLEDEGQLSYLLSSTASPRGP